MTQPASSVLQSRDEIVAHWLVRIAEAGDPEPLLQEFATLHPECALELRELVAMDRQAREMQATTNAPEGPRLQPGQKLGPFEIVRQVAIGGMGEIYEATQSGLNRAVAIKVIRHGRVSPIARARFEREQQILAQLHERHIAPIYASGEEENLQYFAMPFIRGVALHDLIQSLSSARVEQPTIGTLQELVARYQAQERLASQSTADSATCSAVTAEATPRTPSQATKVSTEPQRVFSSEYFVSVAHALASVAEAVERIHGARIIHRDLKPANLMVDEAGQCWIIDFGLAGLEGEHLAESFAPAEHPAGSANWSHGILGTAAYMAPEQHDGKTEPRSDVWGLGTILYELLTWQRAFPAQGLAAIRRDVLMGDPVPPRRHNPAVPRDLEAIALKALRKAPQERYASAAAFSADLGRWLNHHPTAARPGWPWRPPSLWLRRNWIWFTPLLLVVVLGITALAVQLQAAQVRERTAIEREREQRRQFLLLELQRTRLTDRDNRWSDRASTLVREAAEINPDGVQPYAAAILVGPDATLARSWTEFNASSVAIDAGGKRLLFGGWPDQPARVWGVAGMETLLSRHCGRGPVTFRADGTPLQLIGPTAERPTVLLWNIDKQVSVAEFAIPPGMKATTDVLALAESGSHIAAAFTPLDVAKNQPTIVVWDVKTGKPVRSVNSPASCLALTPEGTVLAAGEESGRTLAWSLPDGEPRPLLISRRAMVHCLAFGRSPRPGPKGEPTWLLAAAYSGGTVRVWDVVTGTLLTQILPRGWFSGYDPNQLAFSPTGGMLVVVPQTGPQVYDVFSAELLLQLKSPEPISRNWTTGCAFTPNGRQLAVSSIAYAGNPGGGDVWDLEPGRGMLTLRGFNNRVANMLFSDDGRHMLACSHDWQVGLWERDTGKLLFLWDGPQGKWPDNLGLAISPDGKRVACAAGRQARLWDAETGALRGSWDNLPPGREDALAFHANGALYLTRCELEDGHDYPSSLIDGKRHPRVIRVRNLLGPKPREAVRDVKIDDWNIQLIRTAPDGEYVLASMARGAAEKTWKFIVLDPAGRAEPSVLGEWERCKHQFAMWIDPTGKVIQYHDPSYDLPLPVLMEMPAQKLLPWRFRRASYPGPEYRRWCEGHSGPTRGYLLFERGRDRPLVHLGLFGEHGRLCFSRDGHAVAWNSRGEHQIIVADLPALQKHLAKDGLGW